MRIDGTARCSFVTNTEALTFTLSGVSKISALPQMKFAWVAASGPRSSCPTRERDLKSSQTLFYR